MLNLVKRIESLQNKIEEYKRKYAESYDAFTQAARALENKVNELKAKANSKLDELKERISALEKTLAQKIQDSLDGSVDESELRNISIDLDLLKRQQKALSTGSRKTIIINCQKEINRVKNLFQDAANNYHVLYYAYKKYIDTITQLETILRKLRLNEDRSVTSYHDLQCNMADASMPGQDTLKPLAEYLFDTNIRMPGSSGDGSSDPLAHDVISNYYLWTVHPAAETDAKSVVEKI